MSKRTPDDTQSSKPAPVNWPELAMALAIILIGLAALYIASDYRMGTLRRMGAGFVPISLSVILTGLGVLLVFECLRAPHSHIPGKVGAFALVIGGIFIWSQTIDRLGFVPATFLLVLACALAERKNTLHSVVGLSLALIGGGYLIFIKGLGIPMSAFNFQGW